MSIGNSPARRRNPSRMCREHPIRVRILSERSAPKDLSVNPVRSDKTPNPSRMCGEHPIRVRILSERSESKDLSAIIVSTLKFSNPCEMCTYKKSPRNPFRIRSYKTQDLKPFRMNSYEKRRGVSPLAPLSLLSRSAGFSLCPSPSSAPLSTPTPLCFHAFAATLRASKSLSPIRSMLCRLFHKNNRGGGTPALLHCPRILQYRSETSFRIRCFEKGQS